ncbi:MAG TPA: aldehyde ferredoxin oxidoreductase [Candidatus Margulisbacteria bacterium]|nr:MAG: aldehyde ferredoxin oxidoreductase [Candidatus Margulisbacteria bacterium GWD2_39_127]HAR61899.1 aldehyde ferredoxin oxidoreductase [Candidatus Margulisiibacteriota bacterium]
MKSNQKVLLIDVSTVFYRVDRFEVGKFFGPVDLGLFLAGKYNSLNIGVGLLAGSILPGSNRLIVNGFSPCWGGFYVSSMGGAGLVFDNLGINMMSIVGRANTPSILYLNRVHGEEIQIELFPVDVKKVWSEGRQGIYSMMDHTMELLGDRYETDPRILAVGPAAYSTDMGAIASVPLKNGKLSYVDTWAGRGGFGSKMLREHNIVAVIYGGTFIDDDFIDRKVADQWFVDKYKTKLVAKDLESTTKYRFDPKFETGGTFGVNYTTLKGNMFSLNYQSIYMTEEQRVDIHEQLVLNHYLKQFNEETIKTKNFRTCGEPCVAVCKKMNNEFKKDYEPYQTMGPLCGIFDQRAAEKLNHHADMYGFDAISAGGVLSWLMECLVKGYLMPEELGIKGIPEFTLDNFDVVATSLHNADIGVALLDSIIEKRGIVNLSEGARKFAKNLTREKGSNIINSFVYTAFGRKGWMVPNQYWTPGVLSPMPMMGKYYMHYGQEFVSPRELGRKNAARFIGELVMDNFGVCRFHRAWAEEMIPEIIGSLYDAKDKYLDSVKITASRINSRNASVFWESERNLDLVKVFLEKKHTIEGNNDTDLLNWIDFFKRDKKEAGLSFWYEMHKGIQESLREF